MTPAPLSGRLPIVVAYLPFLLAAGAIYVVSGMSDPPIPEPLVFRFSDKLLHAAAYAVVGACALVGTARRRGSLERATLIEAVGLATLHGAFDELHQAFVPKRSATVSDLIADFVGALIGAWLLRVWLARRLATRSAKDDAAS